MKRVVVFLVLAMVVIGSSVAQSAAADAQRIVGSWTIIEGGHGHSFDGFAGGSWANGSVWVLNANGTGTIGGQVINFGISVDGRIRIRGGGPLQFFIAPNGSRMLIGDTVFQRN